MSSVKKNYFYNLISQLLAIVLPVITTPYVTRVLGNENLGVFNYANSIVSYFILFGCVGLNTYSQREIAACKDDPRRQSTVFYEVLLARIVTLSASLALYWLTVVRTAEQPLYYAVFAIEIFAAQADISWFLQGNEVFKSAAVRSVTTRLLGLACIFLFVKSSRDLHIYILCCSGAILAGNISMWFFVKKMLQPVKFSTLRPWRHFKGALVLFLPQIAVNVYTQLDKTMLGILTGFDYNEVGYYSQAEKIVKLAMTVVTSIGSVMMSRVTVALSRNDREAVNGYIKKSLQFAFLLGWPIAVGVAAISADMVPWFFGPGYERVVPCMVALSPLVLPISISSAFGNHYLVPSRRMRAYTGSVTCGMAVNVAFNLLLIPRFGAMGAVAATLLAETVVVLCQFVCLRREFSPRLLLLGGKNMAAAAVMGCAVLLAASNLPATLWATILEIALGAAVYFAVLLALKDAFFVENLRKILKRSL